MSTAPRPYCSRSTAPHRNVQGKNATLEAFNTWAFKREQPDTVEKLNTCVQKAVATQVPLEFVLYWGKGPRHEIALPDHVCLDYLGRMAERVRSVHAVGCRVVLLQTDTHARLNGHSEKHIGSYFAGISNAGADRGFDHERLSDVITRSGCVAVTDDLIPPSAEMTEALLTSALKWYGGSMHPTSAARRYFAANMLERRAVETCFPDAVFITFNSSQFRDLFPQKMPIFYMNSLRKGCAVKPWFMDAAGNPAPIVARVAESLPLEAAE
jgi:L-tyrosine isonitrile synthase